MNTVLQNLRLSEYQGLCYFVTLEPWLRYQSSLLQTKGTIDFVKVKGFKPFVIPQEMEKSEDFIQEKQDQNSFDESASQSEKNSQESKISFTTRKIRKGPYRKYSLEQKRKAIEQIQKGSDIHKVMLESQIPRRSLLRWKKNGCQRKQGGGRPSDIQMQTTLFQKILNQQINGQDQIRKLALNYSSQKNFKASKGWYVKFCRRFNQYKQKVNIQNKQAGEKEQLKIK